MSADDAITHRTVRLDQRDHHVALAGPVEGPPVMLLHGWPQTSRCWRRMVDRLPDHRLVMPDLRGLGDSDGPEPGPDGAGYAKREIAGDVVALLAALGLDEARIVIVGHDWGGVVAVHAASLIGSAWVRGLVVLDVTVPNDVGAGADIAQGGARWHHAFHRTSIAETMIVGDEDVYYRWFYENFGATADAITPEDAAAYVDAYRGGERIRRGLAYYRAMARDIADARLIGRHGLTMPVLALGGDSSFGRGTEPQECLEHFAADVSGGTVTRAGHWIPEEAPDELGTRLRAFLSELPA